MTEMIQDRAIVKMTDS